MRLLLPALQLSSYFSQRLWLQTHLQPSGHISSVLVRIFFINRLEITFHAKDNMSCMPPTLWGGERRWGMSPAKRVELFLLWDCLNCQIKSVSEQLEASFLGRYAID